MTLSKYKSKKVTKANASDSMVSQTIPAQIGRKHEMNMNVIMWQNTFLQASLFPTTYTNAENEAGLSMLEAPTHPHNLQQKQQRKLTPDLEETPPKKTFQRNQNQPAAQEPQDSPNANIIKLTENTNRSKVQSGRMCMSLNPRKRTKASTPPGTTSSPNTETDRRFGRMYSAPVFPTSTRSPSYEESGLAGLHSFNVQEIQEGKVTQKKNMLERLQKSHSYEQASNYYQHSPFEQFIANIGKDTTTDEFLEQDGSTMPPFHFNHAQGHRGVKSRLDTDPTFDRFPIESESHYASESQRLPQTIRFTNTEALLEPSVTAAELFDDVAPIDVSYPAAQYGNRLNDSPNTFELLDIEDMTQNSDRIVNSESEIQLNRVEASKQHVAKSADVLDKSDKQQSQTNVDVDAQLEAMTRKNPDTTLSHKITGETMHGGSLASSVDDFDLGSLNSITSAEVFSGANQDFLANYLE